MTTHFTTPLYAVSIPKAFQSLLDNYDDVTINETVFTDLNRLSTLIPLNDVFHFIYEQTENPVFNTFINRYGLKSILQLNTNISWMSSVASQYDTYLLDRKTMEKNKEPETGDRYINMSDEIHTQYLNVKQIGKDDIIIGFMNYHDDELLENQSSEGLEDSFKEKLFNIVYDYMGYDALRKHDINKYLTRIGV